MIGSVLDTRLGGKMCISKQMVIAVSFATLIFLSKELGNGFGLYLGKLEIGPGFRLSVPNR